jgi:hypothetical protein
MSETNFYVILEYPFLQVQYILTERNNQFKCILHLHFVDVLLEQWGSRVTQSV